LGTFDSLDFNNYYSFGNFVTIGSTFPNLTALRSGLPQFNQNSYSQNPQYISLTNLHTSSFLLGIYVGVDIDIDGEARCPINVSIGADDENQGFAKPVISTNHTNFFTNYPVRFSNNISGLPGTNVKWYVNGSYIIDSASFQYTFITSGLYKVSLQAERCIYKDSAVLNIQIVPGNHMIVLKGKNPDTILASTVWVDPGYTATDFFNKDISSLVIRGTNINPAVLGTYYFWYTVKDYWENKDSVTRIVVVIDDVPPVLTLIGNDTITIEVFENINDPGATVTDNYYSNLVITVDSSLVNKNVVGIYKMVYTSIDGSGNIGTVIRIIKVIDTGLPLITLIGTDTILVDVYSQYVEVGAIVTDKYCKSGLQWQVDFYPPTNMLATYVLTYTGSDCQGNIALPVKRVVKVVDRKKPTINLNGFAYVTHERWTTYQDSGVSIDDNYYGEDTLRKLLIVTSNLVEIEPGVYNVCFQVTDPSGNKSVKVCRTVKVESTTAINYDSPNSQLGLYPNPNNGIFTLDMGEELTKQAFVIVSDITGKEVYRSFITLKQTTLNLAFLASGIYQLRIQQGNELINLKVNIIR